MTVRYEFDWDTKKAASNQIKHGVSFEDAMALFRDALALSISDNEHSVNEERWVSIGEGRGGKLLVVVHTIKEMADGVVAIRIISARRPTKREARMYKEGL